MLHVYKKVITVLLLLVYCLFLTSGCKNWSIGDGSPMENDWNIKDGCPMENDWIIKNDCPMKKVGAAKILENDWIIKNDWNIKRWLSHEEVGATKILENDWIIKNDCPMKKVGATKNDYSIVDRYCR